MSDEFQAWLSQRIKYLIWSILITAGTYLVYRFIKEAIMKESPK